MYKRLGITPILNGPYSPQFNRIESYFSLIKSKYKKRVLQLMINSAKIDVEQLVRESIGAVEDHKTQNCVRNGIDAVKS